MSKIFEDVPGLKTLDLSKFNNIEITDLSSFKIFDTSNFARTVLENPVIELDTLRLLDEETLKQHLKNLREYFNEKNLDTTNLDIMEKYLYSGSKDSRNINQIYEEEGRPGIKKLFKTLEDLFK